jgi:hypothetical protein
VVICSRLCSSLLTQHGSTPFGRHPSAGAFSGRHFGAGASGRVLWLDRSSRKAHGFWFCCRNFGFLPKGYFLLPVSNFKNPCALHLGAELGKEAKALRGVWAVVCLGGCWLYVYVYVLCFFSHVMFGRSLVSFGRRSYSIPLSSELRLNVWSLGIESS